MTARTDFLSFLTAIGKAANRSLTFEEGSGTPQEFYSLSTEATFGTPTWATDGTYGANWFTDQVGDGLNLDFGVGGPEFITGNAQTVLVIMQKTDATNRASAAFCLATAVNGERCQVSLPWSDGIIYWDFGGVVAPNRVQLAWTKDTSLHAWAFRAGTVGMSIWKDGTKQSGSSATAVTRTTTIKHSAINAANGVSGDIQKFYFIGWVPYELSDSELALFTVDNVLLPTPLITTDSPLPDGAKDTAYSEDLDVVGGTGAITWALVSGALPGGLSLNTSTGLISGTPTGGGYFNFTISVTDSNARSSQTAFNLLIDDPACVPQSVLSLARGSFSNNSRIGPHENGGKKIALILRDADNPKKLNAQYTVNNGVTWTGVLTSALTSNIVSHDSELGPDGTTIHVWTQESTSGRVAYHQFNLTTGLWTLENEQISAAQTIITGAVSGTILSSGVAAIVYESTRENVSAANRKRMTYNDRVGGVWGTAIPMGDIGAAQSDIFGRLIPGDSNRSTMFMTIDPGYSVLSTPDFQLQVMRSNRTLSAISVFRATGLLGTNPQFFVGDWTTYRNGSDLILVVPVKFGGEPTVFSFVDSDTPPAVLLGEPVLGNFVGEGAFVPIVVREIDGTLYFLDFAFPDLVSDSFVRLKTGTSHLGPFSPSGMADQTGPTMGIVTSTTQTMDGDILVRTCQGVDGVYVATAVAIGSVDGVTERVKFEWLKVSDLPTDSGLSLSEWLDSLATQEIDFCCTLNPLIISTCPLPAATVGEEYSYQLLGTDITLWAIIEGSLPAGWTMSASGLISSNGPVAESARGQTRIKIQVT